VQQRLDRTATALENAAIPYAFCGSNATAAWIASVDTSAVRQARNVELVIRRSELEVAELCLRDWGFVRSIVGAEVRFLDGIDGKWRDAIKITFGCEPVAGKSKTSIAPSPEDSDILGDKHVLRLNSLVEFQLARFRLDDVVDLRDLIDVGLVDRTWLNELSSELASRLQELLDNPEG
jgi:hypothetical protein